MSDFEKLYTVEDIAQMTMLTTRTIRNYLKEGLLTGKKVGGQWRFTGKDIEKLFSNSAVEEEIQNSHRQEVLDFVDGVNTDFDSNIQICTLVDYYCNDVNTAKELSEKLSDRVQYIRNKHKYRFYYEYIQNESKARYTLFGTPRFISDVMQIVETEWNKVNNSLDKFTDKAKNYKDYRPSYPEKLIEYILSFSGNSSVNIADIGSGTGKLSKLLLQTENSVFCVEPNDDMRCEAETQLKDNPLFESVNGTAENTTLRADSVDIITCAEAFHWFDNEKSKFEFKRILRKDGMVFLIWNNFSSSNPYCSELGELNDKYCRVQNTNEKRITKDERAAKLFGEKNFEKASFDNTIHQSCEALVGGMLSASFTPKPGDENYDEYVKGIQDIYNKYSKDGQIETIFETVCYSGKLV